MWGIEVNIGTEIRGTLQKYKNLYFSISWIDQKNKLNIYTLINFLKNLLLFEVWRPNYNLIF